MSLIIEKFSPVTGETPPPTSKFSSLAVSGDVGAVIELPPIPKASSLIRKWREREAEEGFVPPTPRSSTPGIAGNVSGYYSGVDGSETCSELDFDLLNSVGNCFEHVAGDKEVVEQSKMASFIVDDFCRESSPGVDDSGMYVDRSSNHKHKHNSAVISRISNSRVSNLDLREGSLRRKKLNFMTSLNDKDSFSIGHEDENFFYLREMRLSALLNDKKVEMKRKGSSNESSLGFAMGRMRGRRGWEELVAKMVVERRRELGTLMDAHHVSKFPYRGRGRLQAMLKLRLLRQQLETNNQPRTHSRISELRQLTTPTQFSSLRQRFNHRRQPSGGGKQSFKNLRNVQVEFPDNSGESCLANSSGLYSSKNNEHQENKSQHEANSPYCTSQTEEGRNHCQEQSYSPEVTSDIKVLSPRHSGSIAADSESPHSRIENFNEGNHIHESWTEQDLENTNSMASSSHSRNDYLLERNHSTDSSWNERNLWVSDLDWQRTTDILLIPSSSQCEVINKDLDQFHHQDIEKDNESCIGESSSSWRVGCENLQQLSYDSVEKFSDNVEILELLQRRRVSTALASDFRDKMDQVVLSLIQRQNQQILYEDSIDQFDERAISRHWGEYAITGEVSVSSSLITLPFQTVDRPDSSQQTSLTRNSSQSEMEIVHELRKDVAQVHLEISELRKLVESCLNWQAKFAHSVKQEIAAAVHKSVEICDLQSSGSIYGRKDNCCICYKAQIDTLLYRCGHMCTCFNCANGLQWGSGKCPVCQCPIVDIVQAQHTS